MAKPLTYRIQNIPFGVSKETLKSHFYNDDRDYIKVKSLCSSVDVPEGEDGDYTATILFQPHDNHHREPRIARGDMDVDKSFIGFTPLYVPSKEKGPIVADIIALSGLAGHAFGSWAHSIENMWLRDYLPKDAPNARILIYGYPATLQGNTSISTLQDYTATFVQSLIGMRDSAECESRPIIFIGHSLGCLIIKKALTDIVFMGVNPSRLPVRSLIFLAPPHRGLNVSALQTVVKGTGTQALVDELAPNSPILNEITNKFGSVAKDIDILSFYETKPTKTIINVDGTWKREGDAVLMVEIASATLGFPKESIMAAEADHSFISRIKKGEGGIYPRIKTTIKQALLSTARIVASNEPTTGLPAYTKQNPLADDDICKLLSESSTNTPTNLAERPKVEKDQSRPTGGSTNSASPTPRFSKPAQSQESPRPVRNRNPRYIFDIYASNIAAQDHTPFGVYTTDEEGGDEDQREYLSESTAENEDSEDDVDFDSDFNDEVAGICDECCGDINSNDICYHCQVCIDDGYESCESCFTNNRATCPNSVGYPVHRMVKYIYRFNHPVPYPDPVVYNYDSDIIKAIKRGDSISLNWLASDWQDLNFCDSEGRIPLHFAIKLGRTKIVEKLLELKALKEIKDNQKATPLITAVEYSYPKIIRLLLTAGANIDAVGTSASLTPLQIASRNGDEKSMNSLLTGRPKIDAVSEQGTPLYLACINAFTGCPRMLLDNGANPNSSNGPLGLTPLIAAAKQGDVGTAELLIQRGAVVDTRDQDQYTALLWAAELGNQEMCKALLDMGANIDAHTWKGSTSLILATRNGYVDTVKLLLERNAQLEKVTDEFKTALTIAAAAGRLDILSLLVDHGAMGNPTPFEKWKDFIFNPEVDIGTKRAVLALVRSVKHQPKFTMWKP